MGCKIAKTKGESGKADGRRGELGPLVPSTASATAVQPDVAPPYANTREDTGVFLSSFCTVC